MEGIRRCAGGTLRGDDMRITHVTIRCTLLCVMALAPARAASTQSIKPEMLAEIFCTLAAFINHRLLPSPW